MESKKTVYVYDGFTKKESQLMGILFIDILKGKESYAFEYDSLWLQNHTKSIIMDPAILPYTGRQFPAYSSNFGLFSDSSPDRWGRMLMMKKERILADKEKRKPKKLLDSDFLLGVYDEARMGGIRLKLSQNGEFLSNDRETATPPWTSLRTLEEAAREFENDGFVSEKWLSKLIRPGSSLGGARPKATVVDTNGQLWIAKFPSKNDDNNTGAWEKVASDLAKLCNLNVPESRLETFSKLGGTFLVKRFDRKNGQRIHFASAMTMLGKTDGASAAEGVSYLDIASFINANGSNTKADLCELWKRIVFNMAISNTDDHLRNHAFILNEKGWRLSPLYDVNPVPYGDELSLNIDEDDNRISFDLAIDSATNFGVSREEAGKYIKFVSDTIKENWENIAKKIGIGRAGIEDMRPAFTECYNC